MMSRIRSIDDVAQRQLCTGCGVCAYMEPQRFYMGDAIDLGRRPFKKEGAAAETGEALSVCPGVRLEHTRESLSRPEVEKTLVSGWGPVRQVYEGFANASDVRFRGSSGGVVTALSLYCIERAGMQGVVQVTADEDRPFLNKVVVNTDMDSVVKAAGSRYSPASPCEKLDVVEESGARHVFVGKPCDIAGAQNARRLRPGLDAGLGVTIGFFCAGVPSTRGVLELLKTSVADAPGGLKRLKFRGFGWPGTWKAEYQDAAGAGPVQEMSYADSWGFLQRYRQWRCYICPDHTSEFADIAVGDPWYRPIEDGEPGKSLILARTELGEKIIRGAVEAGYITLEARDPDILPRSQLNLLNTRSALWGRLQVLRLLGAATPDFKGFDLMGLWLRAGLKDKLRSLTGTAKRVFTKKLRRPKTIRETVFPPDA